MAVEYRIGDCLEVLKEYPDNHFSSCVSDPPYGLAFMSMKWDKVEVYPFTLGWGKEVFRVLKPGAWLAAFGGTRTWHRQACALEDAGFEYRDTLMWLYGSGFPKSLDVSKAIDKHLGVQRTVIGQSDEGCHNKNTMHKTDGFAASRDETFDITAPATPDAKKWQGWGTALKPAWEPILLCRKPLDGTVAGNTLKHGTGGINVDGCRIGVELIPSQERGNARVTDFASGGFTPEHNGRWPANLVLDDDSAAMLDEQSGVRPSSFRAQGCIVEGETGSPFGNTSRGPILYDDVGGASRFFYTAKASRSERERGVKSPKHPTPGVLSGRAEAAVGAATAPARNHHPTVKPLDLMQWLVRLVTPKEGICLEPFAGSGTTILACQLEGRDCLGIEKDAQYEPIIRGRLGWSIESYVEGH